MIVVTLFVGIAGPAQIALPVQPRELVLQLRLNGWIKVHPSNVNGRRVASHSISLNQIVTGPLRVE